MALPGLTPNGRSDFDLPVQIALHHAPKQIREARTTAEFAGSLYERAVIQARPIIVEDLQTYDVN